MVETLKFPGVQRAWFTLTQRNLGLTGRDLAAACDVAPPTMSRTINGQIDLPFSNAAKLAAALRVDLNTLGEKFGIAPPRSRAIPVVGVISETRIARRGGVESGVEVRPPMGVPAETAYFLRDPSSDLDGFLLFFGALTGEHHCSGMTCLVELGDHTEQLARVPPRDAALREKVRLSGKLARPLLWAKAPEAMG